MNMDAVRLAEAERILQAHSAATFDGSADAFHAATEAVRAVEEEQSWRSRYGSLAEFHAAHERLHPLIRFYGRARRGVLAEGEQPRDVTPTQRLEELRSASRVAPVPRAPRP